MFGNDGEVFFGDCFGWVAEFGVVGGGYLQFKSSVISFVSDCDAGAAGDGVGFVVNWVFGVDPV